MVADPPRLQLLRFVGEPWRAQAAIGSVAALGWTWHATVDGTWAKGVLDRDLKLTFTAALTG